MADLFGRRQDPPQPKPPPPLPDPASPDVQAERRREIAKQQSFGRSSTTLTTRQVGAADTLGGAYSGTKLGG